MGLTRGHNEGDCSSQPISVHAGLGPIAATRSAKGFTCVSLSLRAPFRRAPAAFWCAPFGAVIVKDGEIVGRGQNRVLLTGCPVYHAEITAIIDASSRLNPKALLGSDYGAGTILEMIPRPPGSPDLVPERARMLKGCEIYINGAPCPMCMSAIYWSRIDHLYFGASLEDTNHIGFSDAFQYEDFKLPWEERKGIAVTPNFERDIALAAYRAWENKPERHPY